jgi:YesN/AraC family two-component response regulator
MVNVNYGFDKINNSILIWQEKFIEPFNMSSTHYHDAFEIYYIVEGERYYFIKDRTYHLKQGDLVLINIGELHRTIDAGVSKHERILINFKKDFISPFLSEVKDIDLMASFTQQTSLLKFNLSQQNVVQNILFKIVSESKTNLKGSDTFIKILLLELLLIIHRQYDKTSTLYSEHPNPIYKKMSEIAIYINNNYMEKISLNSLSADFFISPYYLSRTFKDVTGFNFSEYLNNVRAKEARRLLTETSTNITEIAEKVGFESSTHFGRVFKSITGLSPLKYRKTAL